MIRIGGDATGDLLPDKLHMTCNLPMSDQVNGLAISLLTSIYISTYRR